MKKTILGIALLALGFTACSNSNNQVAGVSGNNKDVLYSGIVPAADATGTAYILKLDYDADHNFTDGDYVMMEAAIVNDSTGFVAGPSSYSEGDFKVESKNVNGVVSQYVRLIPDMKDALGAGSSASGYFLVEDDGSLTMVGADLTKSENPGLNYTLQVKN